MTSCLIGVGIDIEKVDRFASIPITDRFYKKYYTKQEIQLCQKKPYPPQHLAARFAAKEAVIKAYPKKIFYKQIEILNAKDGKPKIAVHGFKTKYKFFLSLSHNKTDAIALVVIVN